MIFLVSFVLENDEVKKIHLVSRETKKSCYNLNNRQYNC